ncbi:hypothetical protein [Polynucleobacter bastaniensis]|uniref:hypothetical protein n=1 Tax=Polynucleobacter bastaniensis TaxID=2081039 RepID=UPI001C0CFD6F|nr:hypothetical protein [Polynucleobacter bastaniensis]
MRVLILGYQFLCISYIYFGDAYGNYWHPEPCLHQELASFLGITSFTIYSALLFFRTMAHRDYYLPKTEDQKTNGTLYTAKPSTLKTSNSAVFLFVLLAAVVSLAEVLNQAIEAGVRVTGAPKTVVG